MENKNIKNKPEGRLEFYANYQHHHQEQPTTRSKGKQKISFDKRKHIHNFSMFNISRAQAERTRKLEKTKNTVNTFLKIKVLKSMQKQRVHGGTINNILKVT